MHELDTTVEPRAPRRELTHQIHPIQQASPSPVGSALAPRLSSLRCAHRAASRPMGHDPPPSDGPPPGTPRPIVSTDDPPTLAPLRP